jgi:hypothetical protein
MMDEHRYTGPDIPVADSGTRPPAIGSGPVERLSMVRAILPCPTCGHRVVCSIRPKLETEELAFRTPPSPDPAIRIALTATVSCEYYDGEIGGPPPGDLFTPERSRTLGERSASARRGGEVNRARVAAARVTKAPTRSEATTRSARTRAPRSDGAPSYAEATNEALRVAGGSQRAAAAALGLKGSDAVRSRLIAMRALDLLAADVADLIAAQRAKLIARGTIPGPLG